MMRISMKLRERWKLYSELRLTLRVCMCFSRCRNGIHTSIRRFDTTFKDRVLSWKFHLYLFSNDSSEVTKILEPCLPMIFVIFLFPISIISTIKYPPYILGLVWFIHQQQQQHCLFSVRMRQGVDCWTRVRAMPALHWAGECWCWVKHLSGD